MAATFKTMLGLVGVTAFAALASPNVAFAQSGESVTEEDTITVTARRREESLQDVPAAITAFTAADIESAGISSARDFIALTPNVTLVETQNAGNAFVTIRGVSQARNSEPSVAVIIDGVQQTNPSAFSQELVDVNQIEVLRGPQGAIYGRNAIGGAINITTRDPTEAWEGMVRAGVDNGFGYNVVARASGPLSDNLAFAGGVSWRDTEGYIKNEFLNTDTDDLQDLAGRARLVFRPTNDLSFDARVSFDQLDTRALYFVIDQAKFFTFGAVPFDVNDTSLPIVANNLGVNERDIYGSSLQINYDTPGGTLTSTTSWDSLEEVLTGDAFDFKPRGQSVFDIFFGEDWNQSQFLDVENVSQEIRFVSPGDRRVRYILGAYGVWTDRFISTGNMADLGFGVFPVFHTPSTNPQNPQRTFLADEQNNHAWAVFGDLSMDLTDQLELSISARYDEDTREQTTLTPTGFLPCTPSATCATGLVRTVTFDELQPKVTLRYTIDDNVSIYGGYSRGFRSGGFNQSGVGAAAQAAGIVGVGDIFKPEVVDTYEIGFKSEFLDGDLRLNGALFRTTSENSYFFVFIASNSTQNLGNVDEVEYIGLELDGSFDLSDALSVNFGAGLTDSEITKFPDPARLGNQAPLVSTYTLNFGGQYFAPIGNTGVDFRARLDYRVIGDTYWDTENSTVRDPVSLVDLRLGVENADWTLTAWSRNLFDERYNAEFSPGGFLFPAQPRHYGVELTRRF